MSCNSYLLSNFFVAKAYFLKVLSGALFLWTLWVFLSRLPNFKMISVTLNTSFHIDLEIVVKD
jgi:hypothetical protein